MYMGGQYFYRCMRTHGYVCRRGKIQDTTRKAKRECICRPPPSTPSPP